MEHLSAELKRQFQEYQKSDPVFEFHRLCKNINDGNFINKDKMKDVLMAYIMFNDKYISKILKLSILANHNAMVTQKVMHIHEHQLEHIQTIIDSTNELREQSEGDTSGAIDEPEPQDNESEGLPW